MRRFFFFLFCLFSLDVYSASVINTQTENNLAVAIMGEYQARTRYDLSAEHANKDNFQSISKIFTEIATQEKEHAARFLGFMQRDIGDVIIEKSFNPVKIGTTQENLAAAVGTELNESEHLYIDMSRTARDEGFEEIAIAFENIAVAEKFHARRFGIILENLQTGTWFENTSIVEWKCTNCGFHTDGNRAPDKCPACDHPIGYFIAVRKDLF